MIDLFRHRFSLWRRYSGVTVASTAAYTRDVKCWFAENDLLLNADKSEVMMMGTPAQLRAASTVNTVASLTPT